MNHNAAGHLAATVTTLIWGTTFISTKVLLQHFEPVEILILRFVLGFLALLLAYPRRLKGTTPQQEVSFCLAGLCGICLYYLLENIALTHTMASNVGVIISVAPFFTALLTFFLSKGKERPGASFFLGFVLSMVGLGLIHFGGTELEWNLTGDLLALLAAVVWAVYSVLTKRIGEYGYPVVLTTRRIFFYGILFMLPAIGILRFDPNWNVLRYPEVIGNLLFLGLGASALCFVTWNFSVKLLGAVRTSTYIYLVPVVTVIFSVWILKEPVTPLSILGMTLTLFGLILSEWRGKKRMHN